MAMTRRFVEAVIREKHWQPYIKSHWIDLGKAKGGNIITFKDHEAHKFKCSSNVANEIITLSKEAFQNGNTS